MMRGVSNVKLNWLILKGNLNAEFVDFFRNNAINYAMKQPFRITVNWTTEHHTHGHWIERKLEG